MAPHDELDAEFLTQLRFFRGESPDVIEWLIDACGRRVLAADEVLLEPEQENQLMYIVLSGSLQVRLDRHGEPISVLSRGESAGEMSVLDGKHTSAWVVGETATELLELDVRHVWTLITRSHVIAVNLLSVLADRVRSDHRVIDRSRQLKRFYEHHAKVDGLTGLHNRRWLDEQLARLTRRSQVSGRPLGLILLDADRFKEYNDSHGHPAGDAALHALAREIQLHVRSNDVAARYGGEEFVVLLPETGLEVAVDVAERLCASVRDIAIHDQDGTPLPGITISAGVAVARTDGDAAQLLRAADVALYRAKQLGRDRVSS